MLLLIHVPFLFATETPIVDIEFDFLNWNEIKIYPIDNKGKATYGSFSIAKTMTKQTFDNVDKSYMKDIYSTIEDYTSIDHNLTPGFVYSMYQSYVIQRNILPFHIGTASLSALFTVLGAGLYSTNNLAGIILLSFGGGFSFGALITTIVYTFHKIRSIRLKKYAIMELNRGLNPDGPISIHLDLRISLNRKQG